MKNKSNEQFIMEFILQNPFTTTHMILNKAKKSLKTDIESFITILDLMIRQKKIICVQTKEDDNECYLYCPQPNEKIVVHFGNKTHKIL